MLAELRQERERIEEAIRTLERLAAGWGHAVVAPPSLDDCGHEAWSAAGEQEQTEESGGVITSEQTCCRQVPERKSDLNSFYTLTSEKS